jgi:hypothetical protein
MDCERNTSAFAQRTLRPTRKRPSIFDGLFENGIPGGKRSREFVSTEASCVDEVSSDESGSFSDNDDTLGGFLVLEGESSESESEASAIGGERKSLRPIIVSDTDSEPETIDLNPIESDDEEASRDIYVLPETPENMVDISMESESSSDLSVSLLTPPRGRHSVTLPSTPGGQSCMGSGCCDRFDSDSETASVKQNTAVPSVGSTLVILTCLHSREEYHKAAVEKDMAVILPDLRGVTTTSNEPKPPDSISNALYEDALNRLVLEKGKVTLLDFSPILAPEVHVERITARMIMDMDSRSCVHKWVEKWIPIIEQSGYHKIVVLANDTSALAETIGEAMKADNAALYLNGLFNNHAMALALSGYGIAYDFFSLGHEDLPAAVLDRILK